MKVADVPELPNPFPGLRPFREDEEHLFFGRESQVDRMVDKLRQTRFLAVVGTSGSGKSSLVNCGLKPALHRGLMSGGGTHWCMVQFRPGARPIRSMAEKIAEDSSLIFNATPEVMRSADIAEMTLNMSSLGLAHIVEAANVDPETNFLVVVDQFEELFRYAKPRMGVEESQVEADEAAAFVNLLLEANRQTEQRIYVVLTMRSDFLGECSQFQGLPETINESQYLVPRMTREERRQAIAGPIGVSGGELNPVLLTRLVNDVGANPDQLSILQHAVNRTWAKWWETTGGQGELSLWYYEAVGTMSRALHEHAEEAYNEFESDAERKACERIFKALTDRGTDARGIRRPMPLKRLVEVTGMSAGELLPVLDELRVSSRSFLMPPKAEKIGPETMIDISHEVLMRVWERLRTWAAEEAQSANQYRRLAESAELWAENRESLWRDPGLQATLEWQVTQVPNPAWASLYRSGFEGALTFLAESKKVRDGERAEAEFERRWRKVTPYLVVFVFAMFMSISPMLSGSLAPTVHPWMHEMFARGVVKKAGVAALPQPVLNQPAVKDAKQAATSAADKVDDLAERLSYALGVWVAALICLPVYIMLTVAGRRLYRRFAYTEIATEAAAVEAPARVQALVSGPPPVPTVGRLASPVPIPEGMVFAGPWRRFAAGTIDWIVAIVLTTVVVIVLVVIDEGLYGGHMESAMEGFLLIGLSYLLDFLYQTLMVIAPWGGTLGDLATGNRVLTRSGEKPGFFRMSFRYAASLLNLLTVGIGFLIQPFMAARQTLPDLVVGTVVMRKVPLDQRQNYTGLLQKSLGRVFPRWGWGILGALTTAAVLVTILMWPPSPIRTLEGHTGPIAGLAYSPDGQQMASGSDDKTVRLWEAENGHSLYVLQGHSEVVESVAFSPDSRLVASGSNDKTIKVWEAHSGKLLRTLEGHTDTVESVAFSPDGRLLASGGRDKTVRLWDWANGKLIAQLNGHTGAVYLVSFSPDGGRLATTSEDKTIRIWDVAGRRPEQTLAGHSGSVWAVAFLPEGSKLVSGSADKTVKVWDLATGQEIRTMQGGESGIGLLALSPDGKVVAGEDWVGTVHIWNVTTGELKRTIKNANAGTTSIAYSPDGKVLAVGTESNAIALWDVAKADR